GFRDGFGGRQESGRPGPRGRQAAHDHGVIFRVGGVGAERAPTLSDREAEISPPQTPRTTLDNPRVVCYTRHMNTDMDIKYTFRDGSQGGDDVFMPFGIGSPTAAIHEEEDIRDFALAVMK